MHSGYTDGQENEGGRQAGEKRGTDGSIGFRLPAALKTGVSSNDGSGVLHSQNTHSSMKSHSWARTVLSEILTSVGKVAIALSLNAVGGHWRQKGCER